LRYDRDADSDTDSENDAPAALSDSHNQASGFVGDPMTSVMGFYSHYVGSEHAASHNFDRLQSSFAKAIINRDND
jgi:hypothetical protein